MDKKNDVLQKTQINISWHNSEKIEVPAITTGEGSLAIAAKPYRPLSSFSCLMGDDQAGYEIIPPTFADTCVTTPGGVKIDLFWNGRSSTQRICSVWNDLHLTAHYIRTNDPMCAEQAKRFVAGWQAQDFPERCKTEQYIAENVYQWICIIESIHYTLKKPSFPQDVISQAAYGHDGRLYSGAGLYISSQKIPGRTIALITGEVNMSSYDPETILIDYRVTHRPEIRWSEYNEKIEIEPIAPQMVPSRGVHSPWPDREIAGKLWLKRYDKYIEKAPQIIFAGKTFVFSGLPSKKLADIPIVQKATEKGCLYRTAVSSVTDYLVVDPNHAGEGKINTAIELQKRGNAIKVILLEDFSNAIESTPWSMDNALVVQNEIVKEYRDSTRTQDSFEPVSLAVINTEIEVPQLNIEASDETNTESVLSPALAENHKIDPQSNSTFGERYMLDERKYAGVVVNGLVFSSRVYTYLKRAGIFTAKDLLLKTPADLLQIRGFDGGCLGEVERFLSSLKQQACENTLAPKPVVADVAKKEKNQLDGTPNETSFSTLEADQEEETMPTLAEEYCLRSGDYSETSIDTMDFSVRIFNVLMRNGISTVAALLDLNMEKLRRMRNFGKICEDEIARKLAALPKVLDCKNEVVQIFTKEEHRLMAKGDFSFVQEGKLTESEQDFVVRCIEAQEVLGEELATACIDEPEKIVPILGMVREFGQRITWQQELQTALEEVPAYRRNNQAVAYINTFTRHENEREKLLGLYPTPDAPLSAIVNSNDLDTFSLSLAKRFLTWCKYDLKEEIAHLFSVLYPNERNQQVVQQRAQKKTLDQIGRQFGLTRERIRQLETKMQRAFNARQGRIKIISKINADKNNATIVTAANVAEYCTENLQELLFLLRGCESSNFTYDKDLDVFIIGDDSIHERAFAFVEKLPELFNVKDVPKFYAEAAEEYDLPAELVDKAIAEGYRLSGEVYYKSRLSLALIYTEIIKEFYPDGIDAYDPATLVQFRKQILDKYGTVKMPENDRALSARIAGICILCGRGRYRLKQKQYIPKELAQRICDYIEDSDMDIFMTNILFAVFENDLRKYGVDNKYYLQGILHELYGDRFFFTRDYISKDPSITSIYPSIVNFIWCSNYPVTKEQIFERFPGLPEIAISIATSDPEVLAYYGGTFFHVDSLKISEDEKKYLDSVMRRVVSDGGIHHTKEVYAIVNAEKPEIFTRNGALYPFSAGSILEYLFQNHYEFARPFIAKKGVDISSPADRLRDFMNKYTKVTVAQISEFIRDSKINVPSHLDLIDECNDQFFLTDADTLQVIENTGVDREIATEIETLILAEINGTVRIKDLRCWGQLPKVKLPWTDWMVYSTLKKWATKVEVAASYPQFRYAVPLVAPVGKMDLTQYTGAVRAEDAAGQGTVKILDLDNIDDILADILTDDSLGEDLWDSET